MASISTSLTFLVFCAFLAFVASKSIVITPEGQIITGKEDNHKLTLVILGTVDGKTYFLKDCTDEIRCPYMNYTEANQACLDTEYNLTMATIETRRQTDMLAAELYHNEFYFVWTSAREEIGGSSFVWDDNSGRHPNRTAFVGDWDHSDFDKSPYPTYWCGVFDGQDKGMATRRCSTKLAGALCMRDFDGN